MKNEVKKKMMMLKHRSAVRKSPEHNVRLENHRTTLIIHDSLRAFASFEHVERCVAQNSSPRSARFTTPSVNAAIFPPDAGFPPLAHL
jgi:hypothetical protein